MIWIKIKFSLTTAAGLLSEEMGYLHDDVSHVEVLTDLSSQSSLWTPIKGVLTDSPRVVEEVTGHI